MTYYVTYLKDSLGNNYLGIKVPNSTVTPFLNKLKEILGETEYKDFIQNQISRDNGQYHITVINVSDYNRLLKKEGYKNFINSLNTVFEYEIDDLKMLGVGLAQRSTNRAYFVVVKSEKLDAIRKRYNLGEHDFHITLGFKDRDVFGVRKNKVLEIKSKFKQLLFQSFYKNENWNFIKKIDNFDFSDNDELIPVKITDNTIRFKVSRYYIDVGYIEDKFWILSQFLIKEELPRIPQSEIIKILKEK